MTTDIQRFTVEPKHSGRRLDLYLVEMYEGRSRRTIKALIDDGKVRVNGARARAGRILSSGETVEVRARPPAKEDLRATPDPSAQLDVIHEDALLVAFVKPAGIPSYPLKAGELGTAASALVARYPECRTVGDDPREAGLVHRLDGDTSGVLVAARTQDAWQKLREAFRQHQVKKRYYALCAPDPEIGPALTGEIRFPIAHDTADRRRVVVCMDDESAVKRAAQPARTRYQIERTLGDLAWVGAESDTGRMHQIRAHLAAIGLPLAGDPLYGDKAPPSPLGRLILHAAELELEHPNGGRLLLSAPLPRDVRDLLG